MKGICPSCGAAADIGMFVKDEDARECMRLIAHAPAGVGPPLLAYLALFRPGKYTLAWSRARRLLEELQELMASPALNRGGRDYPVTPAIWCRALEQIQAQRDKLRLPLKSHGYLLEIVAGIASRVEGDAEEQREAELRSGLRRGHDAADRNYERLLINSENAARNRMGQPAMTPEEEETYVARQRKHG